MKPLPSPKQLGKAVETLAEHEGLSVRRVRRRIATIALIQLLSVAHRQGRLPAFVVKGGRALEFRFGAVARSSRDVDIVIEGKREQVLALALEALREEWSGFRFSIASDIRERAHSLSFDMSADYNGADWARFEVELVYGTVASWEEIPAGNVDSLGLETAAPIPCITVVEQIAQKLHAVSDLAENRPRDLYDIYIMSLHCQFTDSELLAAAMGEFESRATHPWPPIIELRDGWAMALQELIERDGLIISVDEIVSGVQSLLLRLHGVTMISNYSYRFITLTALGRTPNLIERPIESDIGFETFTRMTEQEGWRLAHFLPYPSRDQTRVIIAALEKAVDVT